MHTYTWDQLSHFAWDCADLSTKSCPREAPQSLGRWDCWSPAGCEVVLQVCVGTAGRCSGRTGSTLSSCVTSTGGAVVTNVPGEFRIPLASPSFVSSFWSPCTLLANQESVVNLSLTSYSSEFCEKPPVKPQKGNFKLKIITI